MEKDGVKCQSNLTLKPEKLKNIALSPICLTHPSIPRSLTSLHRPFSILQLKYPFSSFTTLCLFSSNITHTNLFIFVGKFWNIFSSSSQKGRQKGGRRYFSF